MGYGRKLNKVVSVPNFNVWEDFIQWDFTNERWIVIKKEKDIIMSQIYFKSILKEIPYCGTIYNWAKENDGIVVRNMDDVNQSFNRNRVNDEYN